MSCCPDWGAGVGVCDASCVGMGSGARVVVGVGGFTVWAAAVGVRVESTSTGAGVQAVRNIMMAAMVSNFLQAIILLSISNKEKPLEAARGYEASHCQTIRRALVIKEILFHELISTAGEVLKNLGEGPALLLQDRYENDDDNG